MGLACVCALLGGVCRVFLLGLMISFGLGWADGGPITVDMHVPGVGFVHALSL